MIDSAGLGLLNEMRKYRGNEEGKKARSKLSVSVKSTRKLYAECT